MRISLRHSTLYRYEDAVHPEPHTFRLRPRQDGSQRLLNFQLDISPTPAGSVECLDQDGNVVREAWFREPVRELRVESAFEIETLRTNPFDYMLADSDLARVPLQYKEPLRTALAPYLGRPRSSNSVREFSRPIAEAADRNTLAFLTGLNRALYDSFTHVLRDSGPPFPPETTLRQREGSCRDLAVLFCAACRSLGIPARFVSGYEHEAAFQEHAYMHAWAEVYLAGGGWRGYDPSQGLAVADQHVAVAASAHPRLAAPITGAYRGAAQSHMEFTIEMQVA